ncbi:DNA polymerase III subunit beta [bacterium]|nr:DNA polymerase III subunit beta [bacterium]
MKIECTKENLVESIAVAEKISGKNLTLPVLNNLLLEAKGDKFFIRSTNLDLGVEIEVQCKVHREGTVAVSGSVLHGLVSTLYNSNKVDLEVVNNNLVVSTPSNNALIKTVPHDDFPTLPTVESSKNINIKAIDFINGLKSVWYSASISSIKQELSSVYIYNNDSKIVFVSTDSFRLAEKTIQIKDKIDDFEPILIPLSNIGEIIRVLEYVGGNIDIKLSNNQISFISDKIYLTSRLINGNFPDYKQIIPKEYTTEAVILKQDMVNTLKNTNVFSDKFNQVSFSVNPAEKTFTVSSKNENIGEVTDAVDSAITGEGLNINFNHKYISDCFQSIAQDSVSFEFAGLSKPVVVRGVGDPSFFYLVMPMNK